MLTATGAAGCDGFLSPQNQLVLDDDEIALARVAEDAPELLHTEIEFWAVRGEDREVQIRYAGTGGYNGKCLRFVVPGQALLRRSDGSVIEPGDSVRITIRVVDVELYVFEFDPGGLRFDPAHPARMEVRYTWAADDLNGDGSVDADDSTMAENLAIWRQERDGASWERIPSRRIEDLQEVHADITGFTKYALASDRGSGRATF